MDGDQVFREELVQSVGKPFVVNVVQNDADLDGIVDLMVERARNSGEDEPFFIVDCGTIFRLYNLWRQTLPRVEPFYAVKVNDDHGLLHVLAALGLNFDCASKNEIRRVLNVGVEPERIIYAHPCKHPSHLNYAVENGVKMTTFDNEHELLKIKRMDRPMRLVLRIKTDDSSADYKMSSKFGCTLDEGKRLVDVAVRLDLDLVGVSFHVGSGCQSPKAFCQAISDARTIFDYAWTCGVKMNLLDIGGGFPGSEDLMGSFSEFGAIINQYLDDNFPQSTDVRIIAEPGRYFAMAPYTLCTSIIAKRTTPGSETNLPMYYLSDGKYSSLTYYPLEGKGSFRLALGRPNDKSLRSSVWGPTCCALDCIFAQYDLPEMEIGDWFIFDDMGAYTSANATVFNGFAKPKIVYVARDRDFQRINETAKCGSNIDN